MFPNNKMDPGELSLDFQSGCQSTTEIRTRETDRDTDQRERETDRDRKKKSDSKQKNDKRRN